VLDFDPCVSFPFGAHPVWPPFLDWTIAALARPFVGDAASVERLIVWLPPLLGAATVVVIGGPPSLLSLPQHARQVRAGSIDPLAARAAQEAMG